MRKSLPALFAVVVLLSSLGCVNRDEELREEVTEQTGGEVDTSLTQVMDAPDEPKVQAGLSAAVVISENTIGIDAELEPVLTVFTIKNSGLNDHSLAIEGPGGSWRLETALAPEETANLEVPLQEGTYRVFDPRNEDLSTEVTVREAE